MGPNGAHFIRSRGGLSLVCVGFHVLIAAVTGNKFDNGAHVV